MGSVTSEWIRWKLRMLSNPGNLFYLFTLLLRSKVFKQVVVIKKKNFAYTLSSHPTNNCRYSKLLSTNHALKYILISMCVCHSIDIFKCLFFSICVQEIRSYPRVAKDALRKKWQATPVFLHGPSKDISLLDFSPWGSQWVNTTGWLSTQNININHKKSDKTYIKIYEMIKIYEQKQSYIDSSRNHRYMCTCYSNQEMV